jgi:1-acyl-sn-glycerol-3-phosphate acyltransferase
MSPTLVRLLRPLRRRQLKTVARIAAVEVRGLEGLQNLLQAGAGVLITPNHPGSGDVEVVCEVADRLGRPFHFMAAWQVFLEVGPVARWVLRRHGTFTVDREGSDLRAFKHAVELLQSHPCPLTIFPEGEVYHLSDRVMPFLEGPAAMAVAAARKAERPIAIVPCGVKFFYVTDPTPGLTQAMNQLEAAIYWRPSRNPPPLAERIYRFAEGPLALKELEYLGRTQSGPLPQRLHDLMGEILGRVEHRHSLTNADGLKLPNRIKRARQKAIEAKEAATDEQARMTFADDLDDLFLVAQLYSYPGDYLVKKPKVEHVADTIKKFEEDVLGKNRPRPHGDRRAVVYLGTPIPVEGGRKKGAAGDLTTQLEEAVQRLLDGIEA